MYSHRRPVQDLQAVILALLAVLDVQRLERQHDHLGLFRLDDPHTSDVSGIVTGIIGGGEGALGTSQFATAVC